MKILYLSESFADWTSPNYYHFQQAVLSALPGSAAYGPGIRYETNRVPEIIGDLFGSDGPDAIVCWLNSGQLLGRPMEQCLIEQYGVPGELSVFPVDLDKVNVPKILWIGDFWQFSRDEWDDIILGNSFDFVFATCCPPFGSRTVFDRFFSRRAQERAKFVPWPHSVSPEVFTDHGLPRAYDVTLLGAMYRQFYPLRWKMHEDFLKQTEIVYFNQSHPGYKFVSKENRLVGESYARIVNQSRIFAGCTSIYGIPFQKIYEAMACRSVMMCDRPYGADLLGFVDRANYLAITEDDYVETARHYLAHPDELESMATSGRDLVMSRHTAHIRAEEFRRVLASLLGGGERILWASLFSDARRGDRSWSDPREAITRNWRVYRSLTPSGPRKAFNRLRMLAGKPVRLVKRIVEGSRHPKVPSS